jgi:MFS superfamily sulfate permease-like transporter
VICPHTLAAHVLARITLDVALALCVGVTVACLAMAASMEMKHRQDRRQRREAPEVPPAPERPHVPRAVRDRLAGRVAYPSKAEAIARRLHAREVHQLDQRGPR